MQNSQIGIMETPTKQVMSAVSCLLSAVWCLLSTICCVLSTICCVGSAVRFLLFCFLLFMFNSFVYAVQAEDPAKDVSTWYEWLGLSTGKAGDRPFLSLANKVPHTDD
jgi:hypothetical protein